MIKSIRKFLAARKAEADERRFREGFGWAMVEYFRRGSNIETIEEEIGDNFYWEGDELSPFWNGARDAVRKLGDIEHAQRVLGYYKRLLDGAG